MCVLYGSVQLHPLCCISHTAVLHSNKSKSKSKKNKNNRRLLEKAITFERQGVFATPTYYRLRIVWRVI